MLSKSQGVLLMMRGTVECNARKTVGREYPERHATCAHEACSPPVALLQVKIFSCCFNTNMISLQSFEYFEYKHVV